MNQFPPVLIQAFGVRWFENGNLSLDFRNATVDSENVQVSVEVDEKDSSSARVWMERDDGMLVCKGTASLSDHSQSELRNRDLRPCDPSALSILNRLEVGMILSDKTVHLSTDRQYQRFDAGLISDPLDFYRTGSHWGGIIACPSTLVEYMWGVPMEGTRNKLGSAVGLFGAIEIGQVNGPVLMNKDYHLKSHVVSLGQSPKTEYFWFDSSLSNEELGQVATFRMQLRFMKPSVDHKK
ncbi:MAG: hypothetical protein OEZ23_07465 [Gammaproteobacteria bacterium]|nr:hypothetical protein [Gammaproteobacteria bacterium]